MAATVSTIVAAILLLGVIDLLRLLDQEDAQLAVIAMFTVLFAASVGVFMNKREGQRYLPRQRLMPPCCSFRIFVTVKYGHWQLRMCCCPLTLRHSEQTCFIIPNSCP